MSVSPRLATLWRGSLIASGAAGLLFVADPAGATPEFPQIIQKAVGASGMPACTICHNNQVGGLGTVTTVFGQYMMSRGLTAYNDAALSTALAADQAEMHVSNSQGVTDWTALSMGLDPNDPGMLGGSGTPPPQYGCGARIASQPPSGRSGWLGSLALLALTVARCWSRRRKPHERSATPA